MKYITGSDRSQTSVFPVSLDEAIEETNIVRIIDLFVDSLDMSEMGFRVGHIEDNKQRIEKSGDLYKRRQAIVEHPYGTIKRQWGFSYIITKKFIKRAESDVGFMFISYNLTRLLNIIGMAALKSYLEALAMYLIKTISLLKLKRAILKTVCFTQKPTSYILIIA